MKLLNKLNGWQRLYILATVAVYIWGITKSSMWRYPSVSDGHCEKLDLYATVPTRIACQDWHPLHEIILTDISTNLWLLVGCLAAYVAAYVTVKIVRWVISGFKKEN
jgi:hypothetical protein